MARNDPPWRSSARFFATPNSPTPSIFAAIIGSAIGIVAGYFSRLDDIVMRFMDGIMAIPGILLAIVLMAILGPRIENCLLYTSDAADE